MLSCLSLQTPLISSSVCVNDQDGKVCLTGSSNHVGYKVSVSWGVAIGKVCLFRLKVVRSDVDGHAAFSLLASLVHDPCKSKRLLARLFGLLSIPINGVLFDKLEFQ